jgi:putative ABC transport system ATP-binding protein
MGSVNDNQYNFPAIKIHNLTKRYAEGKSERILFANLQLHVEHGEILALLGRSGSGKSTLLNLISCIDKSDAGQIWINNQNVIALSEKECTLWRRRNLGFIFQFFNLIPTLTIAENVLLPLELNRLDTSVKRHEVLELLASVQLEHRQNDFPENLSGGEQQRIAIIRALAHQPLLLLADEPTGNLDTETGTEVLNLMLDLIKRTRTTAIIVTHSDMVADHADRIMRLDNGQLQVVTR